MKRKSFPCYREVIGILYLPKKNRGLNSRYGQYYKGLMGLAQNFPPPPLSPLWEEEKNVKIKHKKDNNNKISLQRQFKESDNRALNQDIRKLDFYMEGSARRQTIKRQIKREKNISDFCLRGNVWKETIEHETKKEQIGFLLNSTRKKPIE